MRKKRIGTYRDIKKYVKEKYDLSVKSCYIAHVKEKCGLPLKKASNRKEFNYRKYPCPQNKVEPIKEALKYFDLI